MVRIVIQKECFPLCVKENLSLTVFLIAIPSSRSMKYIKITLNTIRNIISEESKIIPSNSNDKFHDFQLKTSTFGLKINNMLFSFT